MMYCAVVFLFDVGEEGGVAEVGLSAGTDEGALLAGFGRAFLHGNNIDYRKP